MKTQHCDSALRVDYALAHYQKVPETTGIMTDSGKRVDLGPRRSHPLVIGSAPEPPPIEIEIATDTQPEGKELSENRKWSLLFIFCVAQVRLHSGPDQIDDPLLNPSASFLIRPPVPEYLHLRIASPVI